jgi:anaerobic dimethyl sulfoxide reductase subunit A
MSEKVVPTVCASHCGGSCLLKVHVKDGVITRIETDDGEEPQLRACLRGRAYRQRVYAPDRLKYPMKRVGARGEGKFERISWDEALDKVAGELKRVRDTYGAASIVLQQFVGDVHFYNQFGPLTKLLSLAGGYTSSWGTTSFHQGVVAALCNYGTFHTANNRDDLVNSKFIIMWGWDPANTVTGTNTCWYLAQAKEAGSRIVSVDPRHTDTTAAFADLWIPIRPGTDCAMLIAMAYVMMEEDLYDKNFIDTYTIGFDQFKEYVVGAEDGEPKTPLWAEEITGVPSAAIEKLAREYATIKPAALMAGIAPGRTVNGEQYHRAAITLAAMTGNIGIHGGDAGARAWESVYPGYPYPINAVQGMRGLVGGARNPVMKSPEGKVAAYLAEFMPYTRGIHGSKLADAILKGKAGGYPDDYKLLYVAHCNYLTQWPNINKIVQALQALEFIVVEEQFMTPTAKFADILLPVNTFMERNDITLGVGGTAFIGSINKVIEPLGESKSSLQIAVELGQRMGITNLVEREENELLEDFAKREGVPDYSILKKEGTYRLKLPEPYVAFKKQIEDPANNPFTTASGKIEIYSQRLTRIDIPDFPPIPKYIETWESRNDPLAKKYPLQLINTHFKRRALSQFDNIPWLRELQCQAVLLSSQDARARNISDGDMVRVFNDRGEMVIPAKVTERIMPGVVDVPHGAWYNPDEKGVDKGGCANVLTADEYSPSGGYVYNTALVEVERV